VLCQADAIYPIHHTKPPHNLSFIEMFSSSSFHDDDDEEEEEAEGMGKSYITIFMYCCRKQVSCGALLPISMPVRNHFSFTDHLKKHFGNVHIT